MQAKVWRWLASLLIVGTLFLSACSSQPDSGLASRSPSATTSGGTVQSPPPSSPVSSTASVEPAAASPSPNSPSNNPRFSRLPRLDGKATVEMRIKGSSIIIEVDGTNAPITAGNFVDLVKRGVYNGLAFHRVVREPQPFVVQGGDPQSKNSNIPPQQLGTGSFIDPETSQPRYVPLEIKPEGTNSPVYSQTFEQAGINKAPQLRHTRGAVAMARSALPDSASAQFYFALADLGFLDGNYAVFGYVTQGMDVVDKVQQGDRIESAKVTKGLENLKPGSKS